MDTPTFPKPEIGPPGEPFRAWLNMTSTYAVPRDTRHGRKALLGSVRCVETGGGICTQASLAPGVTTSVMVDRKGA